MSQEKVFELVRLTWRNRVFPDSYPSLDRLDHPSMQKLIADVYRHLTVQLRPILRKWMAPVSSTRVELWLRQLVAKSTAFCAMVTAGEIDDLEALVAAGVSIALVYWTDHAMDRGDEAMMEAVARYVQPWLPFTERRPFPAPPSPRVRARFYGLEVLRETIHALAQGEDESFLLQEAFVQTLWQELQFVRLSRLYRESEDKDDFWLRYADQAARYAVTMNALVYVTDVIYGRYRGDNPTLPALAVIYEMGAPITLLNRRPSFGIRLFDDWGDRRSDSGRVEGWDLFSINIFNQPHPRYLAALMRVGEIAETIRPILAEAIRREDLPTLRRLTLAQIREVYRWGYRHLPADIRHFLLVSQRVMEAGYANIQGDIDMSL